MNYDNKSSLLCDAEQEWKNNQIKKNLDTLDKIDLQDIMQTIQDIKYEQNNIFR